MAVKKPAASATRKKKTTTTRKKTTVARKKTTATRKKASSKYGPGASESVATELHEMHKGRLRSGTSGAKVTSRKQAIAIGLSEARRKGDKVPSPRKKTS